MITSKLNIVIVSNDSEFAQAMGIRRSVFVDECKLDEKKEFDGNDYCATHILALDGDTPVGTMRIRYFNGFVKMERMCVVKDYRKTDASEQIMQILKVVSLRQSSQEVPSSPNSPCSCTAGQ